MANRAPTTGFKRGRRENTSGLPEKMAKLDDEHRSVSLDGWDLFLARIWLPARSEKA